MTQEEFNKQFPIGSYFVKTHLGSIMAGDIVQIETNCFWDMVEEVKTLVVVVSQVHRPNKIVPIATLMPIVNRDFRKQLLRRSPQQN